MTLAPVKLSADILAALPAIFTGRKAASVAAGILLHASMPDDMRAHLAALMEWITGGQVCAVALLLLGVSAYGSAAARSDDARQPSTTTPPVPAGGRPPAGARLPVTEATETAQERGRE